MLDAAVIMGTLGGVARSCAGLFLFIGTLRDRPGMALFVAFDLALLFTDPMPNDALLPPKWPRLKSGFGADHPSRRFRLVQPRSLERLVDAPAFAAYGLGDLSHAHSLFAQGDNARAIGGHRAALVNALRLCGVDARTLPIADEALLHLGDHAGTSGPCGPSTAGIDGRLQDPEACADGSAI